MEQVSYGPPHARYDFFRPASQESTACPKNKTPNLLSESFIITTQMLPMSLTFITVSKKRNVITSMIGAATSYTSGEKVF